MRKNIENIFNEWNESNSFSGVFSVTSFDSPIYQIACGYRNKAEKLSNELDTAFAIASGTKFFTALSICKLIDNGYLSLNDRVSDIIPYDLKMINREITVFHLLTHTSGMGDYIDEELSSDYNDILKLYDTRPVHKWNCLEFYLPMFNELPQKFKPGERVSYSNAGFILLGLALESVSKKTYHKYIEESIIQPLNLSHTGFYRMNNLPGNTALGYIYDESLNDYITNVLYMPIIGGSDGGIFTTANDLVKLWQAVLTDCIFSSSMRDQFFTPHGKYGLGVYLKNENRVKHIIRLAEISESIFSLSTFQE